MKKTTVAIWLLLQLPMFLAGNTPDLNQGLFDASRIMSLSQFEGLSSPKVGCILKDRKGYIWIGTDSGLNRYDGTGITLFIHNPENSKSLGNNEITELHEDWQGTLWIGTKNGLFTFNPVNQSFTRQVINPNEIEFITSITSDKDRNLWIGTKFGLVKYNFDENKFLLMDFPGKEIRNQKNFAFKLLSDEQGVLWIGSWEHGIYRMNPLTGAFQKFVAKGYEDAAPFVNGRITSLAEGPDGSIWLGSWGNGLIRLFPDRQNIQYYQHQVNNSNSLNGSKVKSLEFDASGYLWIGLEESGMDRLAPETETFTHFFSEFQTTDIYEGKSVYSILIDDQSLMWLGFRNDGVKVIPLSSPQFKLFHKPGNTFSKVFSICEMPEGIYAGVKGALEKLDVETGSFQSFPLPTGETPISLFKLTEQKILLGTYLGNIFEFNTLNQRYTQFGNQDLIKELNNQKIECFYLLSEDELLIGAQKGLYRINRENLSFRRIIDSWVHSFVASDSESLWVMSWKEIYKYYPETGKLNKIISDAQGDIKAQYFTSNNNMAYLGTDHGFYRKNLISGETHLYRKIFPFQNNQVNSMLADNQQNLWLASENSLIFYDTHLDRFKTFQRTDGLPNIRFYDGVSCLLKNGSMAFGGEGGLIIFDPMNFSEKTNTSNLTFTKLSILNVEQQSIEADYPFKGDISEISDIDLKFRQNIISFQFALLSYINPAKHRYQYLLEGFNDQWFDLGNQHTVTFTNLDPGDYTLKIKAANEENNWSPVKELHIRVHPPIYQTWYAYIFYVLVLTTIYLFIRQFYKNKEKLKSRLKDEHLKFEKMRAKAKHESEFSQMRLKFFTNISHEFRTPLTLILGPLENFTKHQKWPTEEHLKLMHKNAERLQRLITQILDFRSLEYKSLKLEPSWGDVTHFIKETAQLFTPLAQQKGLHYSISDHAGTLNAWFDRDKVEKIIYNLLSNAFKHTQKGQVSIEINRYDRHSLPYQSKRWNDHEYEDFIEIMVVDSGNGIPEDKLKFIFDRFFHLQSDNQTTVQGTGIGLALTRELVNLHNGKIYVKSKLNEGSTFFVVLPLKTQNDSEIQGSGDLIDNDLIENIPLSVSKTIGLRTDNDSEKLPVVLVVEDNDDLRAYMRVEFSQKFEIIEAENGKAGLQIALDVMPDLIISDLIMPEMDGIELCKSIKNEERTSHIPIIILTAHGSHIDKVRGYEIGADDYVTKPFSSDLLILRIENLLKNRKDLQTKFSREVRLQPKDLPISSMDERFLTKAMEVVEENLNNSDFSADSFASEMCMSRVHLYRKLKALTDQSVSDFVKTARLKLAARLIGENKLTIKEAAYTVGFKDPKYFSKCFKQQFGVKPSEYEEEPTTR